MYHHASKNLIPIHRSRPRHLPWRTDRSRNIRIMVADVLEQVESGMAWDAIAEVIRMVWVVLDGIVPPIAYLKFKFLI